MWRNWNPLNPPINNVSSEEEHNNYESADENDPNNLVSPNRPHQSPTASPRALLVPDQPDVAEVLEAAGRQLRQTSQRVERQRRLEANPANQPPPQAPPAIMENFEDENGVDDRGALQEACRSLERYQWDDNDIPFFFGQIEIKMAAVGVKKNFTNLPHTLAEQSNVAVRMSLNSGRPNLQLKYEFTDT